MKKKKEIIEDYEHAKKTQHGITNLVELANIRKDFEKGFDAGYKYAIEKESRQAGHTPESNPFKVEGLRRVAYLERSKGKLTGGTIKGYFHKLFTDADNEPCAVIELLDGSIETVYAPYIKFLDRP